MEPRTHFARVSLVSVLVALCTACGGGGGSGSDADVVRGTVLTPAGQSLPGPGAPLAGLLPAPDGTPVALVRVDATGAVLETFDDTVTSAGRYAFDLTELGLKFASDLAVVAGGGATTLRASAVEKAVDVDPLSEAVLQLVLQQGTGLAPFTPSELRDLIASVRLLAAAEGLVAQADVPATVAVILQAIDDEPALLAFFVAAAAQGQTSVGPGDIGDYFPLGIGDAWKRAGSHSGNGSALTSYTTWRRVVDAPSGSFRIEESNALGEPGLIQHVFTETGTALVYEGNDDPDDPLTALVAPYDQVRFPLRAGEHFQQFALHDFNLGQDLDRDGKLDHADARSVVRAVGFEDVIIAAGTFAHCLRLDTTLELTLLLSSGIPASSTLTTSEWLAPHRGPVRSETTLAIVVAGQKSKDVYAEALTAFQVDDEGLGVLPPNDVALALSPANSDTDTPGRPALAFDGAHYLVVTVRDGSPFDRLVGVFVTQTGLAGDEFPIVSATNHMFGEPQVAFDGVDYLVVYGSDAQVRGVRVTAGGTVLDPTGFAISTSGTSNSGPALGFDGANYLVTWRHWDATNQGDVYASRVTPGGVPLGEFVVGSTPADQVASTVAFDGGEYLVAWLEDAGGSSSLRGTRVSVTGSVLVPAGFELVAPTLGLSAPSLGFDGTRHLVVWSEQAGTFGVNRVRGRRFELDGSPADPAPFSIASANAANVDPAVAFDGTNWFVAWDVRGYGIDSGVYARRVTPAGVVLDGASPTLGLTLAESDDYEQLVHPALAAGAHNLLVVWLRNRELSGTAKDIDAALVYPF